jgi:hypothetical protein
MSAPIHNDLFTEVVNSLMEELYPLPYGRNIILSLLAKNLDSPILPEIHRLSLPKFNTKRVASLLPALAKMSSLTSLALPYCAASPDHIKFLFTECPALSKLQSLDLTSVKELKSEDLHLLSQSTTLANLTSLNLTGCSTTIARAPVSRHNSDGFVGFGSFGGTAALLSQTDEDDDGLGEDDEDDYDADEDEDPEEDHEYDADYDDYYDADNYDAKNDYDHYGGDNDEDEDSSGLIALLSSPVLKNLTHLDLGNARLTTQAFIALATSPHLTNLLFLNLSNNMINADVVASLAASVTLTNLTHINLANIFLGDKFLTQLFSPPSLLAKKLQSLDIGCRSINSSFYRAVNSDHFNITISSLGVLLKASPHLNELILAGNYCLGAKAAKLIAANMPNLTKLDLHRCGVSNEGITALATSTALTNLRELDLSCNHASEETYIAFVNSPVMANLTHLKLNNIQCHDILPAIARSPSMSKLQHLEFGSNQIPDGEVFALSRSTTLTNLTWLNLCSNLIKFEAISYLCDSPVVSNLTHLDLSYCQWLEAVAEPFAAPSSKLYKLRHLVLNVTNLLDDGVLKLLSTPNLDQLDVLEIEHNGTTPLIQALYRTRFDGAI